MHEPLPDPLIFDVPGVMPGGMISKQREHATVPISHPDAGLSMGFILNIKTPACWADISAGSAIDAGKCFLFPERGIVEFKNCFVFQLIC